MATVAIEECAVKCFLPGSPERISHLFCHLSDGKQQDPAVAMDHTSTLVCHLKNEKALKKKGAETSPCLTHGCSGESFCFDSSHLSNNQISKIF